MAARNPLIGSAKTTRLRKLECDRGCGYIVRVSRSAMSRGLPGCPCGGRLVPCDIDDIWACVEQGSMTAAEGDARPASLAYVTKLHSVERGQERAAGNGRRLGVTPSTWEAPHDKAVREAHDFIRSAAARAAAAREAAALQGLTDDEPIPF